MRYCVHCGAPLEAGQRFCSSCGRPAGSPAAAVTTPAPAPSAPLPPPPPPATTYAAPLPPLPPLPPRRRSGGRVLVVALLVLAVVGAGVGAFALVRHLTAPDAVPAAAASSPATTPATPTPPSSPASTSAPTSSPSSSPTSSATETSDGPTDDATAAVALRRLAAEDRPAVLALHGAWTVQLTSKTDGTVDASGRVWHWLDIWNLHQQLLASHPGALLVDTGEWGSYQLAGYYATITGATFPTKAATLAWCRGNHLDRDACAGKRVRVNGDYRTDIALQPE